MQVQLNILILLFRELKTDAKSFFFAALLPFAVNVMPNFSIDTKQRVKFKSKHPE